jgi:hypothetical protein
MKDKLEDITNFLGLTESKEFTSKHFLMQIKNYDVQENVFISSYDPFNDKDLRSEGLCCLYYYSCGLNRKLIISLLSLDPSVMPNVPEILKAYVSELMKGFKMYDKIEDKPEDLK